MIMTDEQKYSAVLKELGEVLQSKNTTISCQSWEIDQLKEKLAATKKACDEAINHAISLDEQLLDAEAEIEKLKGEKTC